MNINLLAETTEALKNLGYSESDIAFCQIGYEDDIEVKLVQFPYEYFKNHADFEYDNGYGAEYVQETLKIVFKDNSWIERNSYDGSEWWDYKKCPVLMEKGIKAFKDNPNIPLRQYYKS